MVADRKLILWDLDGTLCPHNVEFYNCALKALAQAPIDMGADISFEQAFEFAQKNYTGQRKVVKEFANKFNFDADKLFQQYYRVLRTDFLNSNDEIIKLFDKYCHCFEFGVLTNASFLWAKKSLTKLRLYEYFNPKFIFGYDEVGELLKTDEKAIDNMLNHCCKFGYTKQDIIIVDDKVRVVEILQNFGIKTILFNKEKQQKDMIYKILTELRC